MKIFLKNPYISQIELTNYCNLKCPMCPRVNNMTRKIEYMDLNLFKQIILDIDNITPGNGGKEIQLYQFGESLLHPEIDTILKLCSKYRIRTMISTNGTSLNLEKRKIIIGNMHRLWISFDTVNKEQYELMRVGASFDKVVENITNLMKEKGDRYPIVILSTLIHDKKEEYEAFWRERGVKNFLYKGIHNWRGEEDVKKFTELNLEIPNKPCDYLLYSFCVLVDGSVVPCCMDYNGDMVLGNLRHQTIGEVWYGEKYKNLRIQHFVKKEKSTLSFCKNCTNYPSK